MTHHAPYDAALLMYSREHDRWHQWALFFFGAIISTFVVADRIALPLYVPSCFALLLSLMWIGAASSIRASTEAWRETLLALEAAPSDASGAFHLFKENLDRFDRAEDFRKTLMFWRRQTFTSVTRLLIWFGIVAALAFLAIAILSIVGITKVDHP
jgi:hypothetical protein